VKETVLKWLLFPGESAAEWLVLHAPSAAGTLGLAEGTGRSTLAIALAILSWLAAALVIGYVIEKIRDIDRKLTSYVVGRYTEAQRQIRILRRRIASTVGALREQKDRVEPVIGVEIVVLPQMEARVLRCFGSSEGAVRALSADEISRKLKVSLQQVEAGLKHLLREHFVERAFGTDEGRETLRITRAGQIYLLEH
jgi:DNA-binding MarR family transcriptional regulator